MKKIILAAAVAGSMAFAPAHAAVVSFADYADTNGEQGVADGTSVTINGVTMILSATAADGSDAFAYFDATSDGREAGLGVCRDTVNPDGTGDCVDGSDDSIDEDIIGAAETVTVDFPIPTEVTGISFRDGEHFDLAGSTADVVYSITHGGGTDSGTDTFANVIALIAGGFMDVTSMSFGFASGTGDQFYINTITADQPEIPIPGALPLLLSGLAGLGFAGRKRKTA